MTLSVIILIAAFSAVNPGNIDLGHNSVLNVACIECHTRLSFSGEKPPLRGDVGEVCVKCHEEPHGIPDLRSHPMCIVPSMRVPPDMLLDSRGRIGCITCHDFHGEYRDESGNKRFYLRRSRGKVFCYSCHKKLPGRHLQEIRP